MNINDEYLHKIILTIWNINELKDWFKVTI